MWKGWRHNRAKLRSRPARHLASCLSHVPSCHPPPYRVVLKSITTWGSHLSSSPTGSVTLGNRLSLSVPLSLICKMGEMIVPASQSCHGGELTRVELCPQRLGMYIPALLFLLLACLTQDNLHWVSLQAPEASDSLLVLVVCCRVRSTGTALLGPLLRATQGCSQSAHRAEVSSGAGPGKAAPRLTRVVGRSHFLVAVGLRAPASSRLPAGASHRSLPYGFRPQPARESV